jgi:Protein of unknown function (DUF1269)
MTELGPVQLIAAGFGAEARYEGRIAGELERIEASGSLRVLDVLFVRKDAESGELQALNAQGAELGGIVRSLLGLGNGDGGPAPPASSTGRGVTRQEIEDVGAELGPGEAAGILLIEHVWARGLEEAIRETGGTILQQSLLDPQTAQEVAAQVSR